MDVTKHTFNEELDNIVAAIDESTFLAIDTEFTGLDAEGCSHNGPLDTPVERYAKLRYGSSDFLVIQYGLCAFKFIEEKQIYEAKPYNFYLFPVPFDRKAPDRRFLCQSSSIDFLVSHGFDFNKVFRSGIPYLSMEQEHKLKAALKQKHSESYNLSSSGILSPDGASSKKTQAPVPEDQKEFLNDISEEIQTFLDGEEKKPLQLQPCNAFQRKLVYQMVEEKFPLVQLKTKTGEKKERYLIVHSVQNAEELAKKEREDRALEMMELDIQVGFTKVIRAITNSGKLVVGHNMFLDVLHSLSHFHGCLPDDLDDFKSVVQTVFPRILDTKLLANTAPFKDFISFSSLDELRQTLTSKPFSPVTVKTAPGFDRYGDDSNPLHEAGYDAFVTGSCFATMCRFLGTFQNPPSDFLLPSSHAVEPFVNKLFLMRINDIPYLNLAGPDLDVNRDHVFHVTFPKEWRASDLYSLFDPYGNIQIAWLSETTAYVSLHNKKNAAIAFQALSEQKGMFHVVSYAFHHRNKSMSWSSASKRKLQNEGDLPPTKVKRSSLSNENAPAESKDSSSKVQHRGETDSAKIHQDQLADQSSGAEMKPEDGRKLFDESSDW